ncbi:MAG: YggS family pyridoxal phosphate-dependent enzyme [Flavobacteriales bacterium]|jgi:pyridoxal phosphate enzyme (YggS family)|nr:YggS family pyridoxal phosphate-dependent enzyme [Flavobacteriales bacterium]MDG1439785.1 YggS family pyridoxal phosphate-dependent enzyme [Flavobacteriales bacterium]MDG1797969.1 YggS family pyridoxal phosphate-dependent enzyme [Flavobacteriales bacterium]
MVSEKINILKTNLPKNVTLVAVSKTKSSEIILEANSKGHLDFGENKVQELVQKYEVLPKNIRWHMIGHLQSNKVKYIAPFVHLIHGVDSVKILKEINKQGLKNNKKINCLLQIHIAKEQNKFGFDLDEIKKFIELEQHVLWKNIIIKGVMGMATFTENKNLVKKEFEILRSNFEELKKYFTEDFDTLSMGMSGDYKEAILAGSNMVRIGSSIFGRR